MSGYDPDNFTHVYLRRLDSKLDRVIDDVADLKLRMTALERGQGELKVQVAAVNGRIDRIENRLERVERRLDLREDALMEAAAEFERPDA